MWTANFKTCAYCGLRRCFASCIALPARPRSDPAREPLSRFQRFSLTLNAIGLVISALGFTAVIVSIRTAQEQMSCSEIQTSLLVKDRSLANVLALDRIYSGPRKLDRLLSYTGEPGKGTR